MTKKILKVFGYIFSGLIFLTGVLVFCYPFINGYTVDKNTETALENFHYLQKKAMSEDNSPESQLDTDKQSSIYKFNSLYKDMQKYNEDIFKTKQSGLKDAWSYEQAGFDLSKYGVCDAAVAEIRIPKMNVDLPVYLGATWSNMAKGATQLGQTSMPIGGINTNCVIAGHRGSSGGKFFLDIENLNIGDKVYIDNLWETLTYKVCKIDVISPDDIDKILIQKGRDMVTLITCHPYPHNYQRYVVYCERIQANGSNPNNTQEKTDISSDESIENEIKNSSQMFIVFENILYIIIPLILIILAIFLLRNKKYKK